MVEVPTEWAVANPSLVWVDLRQVGNGSVVELLDKKFAVTKARNGCEIPDRIVEWQPNFLIFEYDFPDIPRLKALQQTKTDYPHLPILMLTEHHSESLAVWSFRSGVRDYVVKPVDEVDLIRICIRLQSVTANRANKCSGNCMPQPRVPWDARIDCTPTSAGGLTRALEYLKSHFHEKVPLDLVASLCDLDRFEFSRAFRKHFGITFREYLVECRIKKAIEMLGNPKARIIDIAYMVGFRDVSYFTKTFRKYTGLTPSEYRRSAKASDTK